MTFEAKPTTEIIQIANAGGGFKLDASSRPTIELVQIASAASNKGARVVFSGISRNKTTVELIQIANAGGGSVSFED